MHARPRAAGSAAPPPRGRCDASSPLARARPWHPRCPRSAPSGPRDGAGRGRRGRLRAAQAVLAGVQDVGRAAVDPADGAVRRVAHDAALGREHHAVAPAANGASHELLVGEGAVHVRRVEQRHAEVERAVDGGDRLRLVARTVELAHAHAAEADGGDLERAQSSRLHAAGVRPGISSRNPRRSRASLHARVTGSVSTSGGALGS